MAPNKRKIMNPSSQNPTPQNTTNTKYGNMPLNSLHHINKLLGALVDQTNCNRIATRDVSAEIDAEILLFNRNNEVVLWGPEDPLYNIYKHIGSSVPIKWKTKDARPCKRDQGCNIL